MAKHLRHGLPLTGSKAYRPPGKASSAGNRQPSRERQKTMDSDTKPSMSSAAARRLNLAAVAMGRCGGRSRSTAKQAAARANAQQSHGNPWLTSKVRVLACLQDLVAEYCPNAGGNAAAVETARAILSEFGFAAPAVAVNAPMAPITGSAVMTATVDPVPALVDVLRDVAAGRATRQQVLAAIEEHGKKVAI